MRTRLPMIALAVCAAVAGCKKGGDSAGNDTTAVRTDTTTVVAPTPPAPVAMTDTTSTTDTAKMSASGAVDSARGAADYDRPAEATKATQWVSNPAAANPTYGDIAKGDTVYFNRARNEMATWQDAKIKKTNERRFVHPADFKDLK